MVSLINLKKGNRKNLRLPFFSITRLVLHKLVETQYRRRGYSNEIDFKGSHLCHPSPANCCKHSSQSSRFGFGSCTKCCSYGAEYQGESFLRKMHTQKEELQA